MSKEVTVEVMDKIFDDAFEGIDVSNNDKSEPNSVSLTQIRDAYNESRENY